MKFFTSFKTKFPIIRAVTALCVSVVVFALVCASCFAWFAQNQKVDSNGINCLIEGPDITDMTVNAYKLKNKTQSTTTVTYEIDTPISKLSNMNEYDMLTTEVSAVLIEINYSIKQSTSTQYKTFTLSVTCENELNYVLTTDDLILSDEEEYICNLSYAVGFKLVNVDMSDNSVTTTVDYDSSATFSTLDNSTNKFIVKNTSLTIDDGIKNSSTQTSGTVYILMDYSELNINNLYALLLEKGNAALQTRFVFNDDIKFKLQEN